MKFLMAALALFFLTAGPAQAQDDTQGEIENLKGRIDVLEKEKAGSRPFSLEIPGGYLRFSGLIEVEGFYSKAQGGDDESDLLLATALFSTQARITENIGGHISLLYEEDETDLEVDEAVLVLSCPRDVAGGHLLMTAGQTYLPFGEFRSFFISDPLTLELGETRDTAVLLGWEGALSLTLGAFSGEADDEEAEKIDGWVLSLGAEPAQGIAFGLSLLSDLGESDAEMVPDSGLYGDEVPAAAAFFSLLLGPVALEAEYLTAIDTFSGAVVEAAAGEGVLTGSRPRAWNVEAAWIPTDRWQVALKAEGARDFLDDLHRYGGAVSRGLFEQTVLGLEYLYGDAKGEGNSPTHAVTAQLALEF